jgi:hypothetical protein
VTQQKRVFESGLKHCPNCGGELTIIAAILDASVIERILTRRAHFVGVIDTQPTAADSKDRIKSVNCRARGPHGRQTGRLNSYLPMSLFPEVRRTDRHERPVPRHDGRKLRVRHEK